MQFVSVEQCKDYIFNNPLLKDVKIECSIISGFYSKDVTYYSGEINLYEEDIKVFSYQTKQYADRFIVWVCLAQEIRKYYREKTMDYIKNLPVRVYFNTFKSYTYYCVRFENGIYVKGKEKTYDEALESVCKKLRQLETIFKKSSGVIG